MAIEEVEAWNAKQFERRKVRAFQYNNVLLFLLSNSMHDPGLLGSDHSQR